MHGLFILNLLQCLSSYCTLVITCIKTIIGFVQNVPQRFILVVEEVITLTKVSVLKIPKENEGGEGISDDLNWVTERVYEWYDAEVG